MIADVMSLKKFQQLRRFFHFVDSTKQSNVNANDKLFKIKPIIDMVLQECIKMEPEKLLLVDE